MVDCESCKETIEPGAATIACGGCEATYHRSCRIAHGSCATPGCARAKRLLEPGVRPKVAFTDSMPFIYFGCLAILALLVLLAIYAPLALAPFAVGSPRGLARLMNAIKSAGDPHNFKDFSI